LVRSPKANAWHFPTAPRRAYAKATRRPDPMSLEEPFRPFLLVLPMGYFAVRWLLALITAL
jgi:hypothetical protein